MNAELKKICDSCGAEFILTPKDLEFYRKMVPVFLDAEYFAPLPRLCGRCREQRRLAIRNERNLYKRRSSFSGVEMVSFLSPDKPYKVFSREEWWSDKWDAMEYGRDFDFSRPFFEQFNELMIDVPRMSLSTWQSENADYCSFTDFSRNCYLVFGASSCEDCYYSNLIDASKDCIDTLSCKECELGFDSIDCVKCVNFVSCIKCENSNDLKFCFDCKSCSDCFACYNLSHKKYCIFNEQYSKEEYFKKMGEVNFGSRKVYAELKRGFLDLVKNKAVHRFAKVINCENCTGDNLVNSRNSSDCFESSNLEDCGYVQFSVNSKDCRDLTGSSAKGGELVMEAMSIEGKRILAGYYIAAHSDVYYCDSIFACRDIFGCIGVKNKQYCIFNKQYSKEEYEKLVKKIVEHMISTGEWGEFFPIKYSNFAYNETVANEYFPLSKDEILKRGYKWKELDNKEVIPQTFEVPDDIREVSDEIVGRVLLCESLGKNFRIIPQELKFYKKMGVPVPVVCPDKRHEDRMLLRNPRCLWERACSKCGSAIQSTYSPDRTEKVYCEQCYLKEVF